MKDALTIFFAALACLGCLLLWPAPHQQMPSEIIDFPAENSFNSNQ